MKYPGYAGINQEKMEGTFSVGGYTYTFSEVEKARKDGVVLPGYEDWDGTLLNDHVNGMRTC